MDFTLLPRSSFFRLAALLLAGLAFLVPSQASAHPADQLLQHLQLDLTPDYLDLTISIGGGPLAKDSLIAQLDTDGDGVASASEIAAWQKTFIEHLAVSIDQRPLLLDPYKSTVIMPDLQDFYVGIAPIEVTYRLPAIAAPRDQHMVAVTNDYQSRRSAYTFDVSTQNGIGVVSQGWPSSDIRVIYGMDLGTRLERVERISSALASTALGARAAELFGRDRTPAFFLVLLGTFMLVGALHAAQPGHGKALVAGYLVATQGTMRDAFTLASIVTFTHTAGVFALGGVTIAASAIFLPSKVVPVMQALSAVLVVLLGLTLFRRALFRPVVVPQPHSHNHAKDHAHEHHDHEHDHHHHDHARLTDEEHARLHLEEALAMRNRTSFRDLLTLGIAGGIVPCPEALAILLLAIGLHQAWLGMLSILAFSVGLAAVLVAFGAVVAFLQSRSSLLLQRFPGGNGGALGTFAGRASRWLPAASAVVITTVGMIMLLSQLAVR